MLYVLNSQKNVHLSCNQGPDSGWPKNCLVIGLGVKVMGSSPKEKPKADSLEQPLLTKGGVV